MADRLAIVTPWYPSPSKPFGGAFVRTQAMAVGGGVASVDVLHLDEWPMPVGRRVQRRVQADARRMLGSPATRPRRVQRVEGFVTRVPVPVLPRSPYALAAEAAVEALSAALDGGRIDADVVHAHVGLPAGLAAVRLAAPGARVVVTEHATFLDQMIEQPAGMRAYQEVLQRCDVFIAVSVLLRDQLVDAFPQHARKVEVIPNVVPFESVPPRPEPVVRLRRWLYVGSFQERKGVRHVLEAFALCHDEDPTLRLTMVGGGPQQELLTDRAAALGVADDVEIRGAVPPDAVYGLYHDHDLLVHASRYETFGMTIIEALAAGVPVLVTRCGGPEETLRDLDGVAGRLVDVGDGPAELVRGFRQLRDGMHDLDLDRARGLLEARYGASAVGGQLLDTYSRTGDGR